MSRDLTHELMPRTDHDGMSRRLAVLALKRAVGGVLQPALMKSYETSIKPRTEERLVRHPQDDGEAEGAELTERTNQVDVVLQSLSEADAWIDCDSRNPHSRLPRGGATFAQVLVDLEHDVRVEGPILHVAGRLLHVHQDDPGAPLGDERQHRVVEAPGADVVHDRGAGVERRRGHAGLGRVDADRDVRLGGESADG